MEFTAGIVAQLLKGTVEGDPEIKLNTIAKIESGHEGALSFLANPKYEPYIYTTGSSVVLVRNDFKPTKKIAATLIRVADPYQSIAILLAMYEQAKPKKAGIHPSAVIEPSAKIGKEVYIGAFVYVGENSVIGDGCSLYPHVFLGDDTVIGENSILNSGVKVYKQCVIGKDCIIHAGTVIGADGFGFAPSSDNNYMKVPQIGNVVIEDNVEIGANACVDRSTMGSTVIHKGVKLDNMVQIGHNAEVGENTVIAALTGLAGSAKVGKNCMIGGQVGIVGHISVADGTKIGAQAGITGTVKEPNLTLVGMPAFEYRKFMRCYALFSHFPEISKKIDDLVKEVESLKNK
jgi:UDP-3-O-[3-hydroxymyristoyl] glucosamine N-acyltransferase